jgi:hypothetical protein
MSPKAADWRTLFHASTLQVSTAGHSKQLGRQVTSYGAHTSLSLSMLIQEAMHLSTAGKRSREAICRVRIA